MKITKQTIIRVLLTVLTLAAIGAIFYHSSMDAVQSSDESGGVLDFVLSFLRSIGINVVITDHMIRKAAHFIEYFVLGVLLSLTVLSYWPRRSRVLMIALPAGAVVAVCDELIQLTAEGRSCQASDMLLDSSAVLCAALLIVFFKWLLFDRKKVSR